MKYELVYEKVVFPMSHFEVNEEWDYLDLKRELEATLYDRSPFDARDRLQYLDGNPVLAH